MSLVHEADLIRYAGVTIALLGVAIAAPDGIAEAVRYGRTGLGKARGWLARFVPRLRRPIYGQGGLTLKKMRVGGAGGAPEPPRWGPDADNHRKIELLHLQHDLLLRDMTNFKNEVSSRLESAKADLEQAEARLRTAHGELTEALRAKDRRAAQVDARGLWPIGFGIVLTGIPGELADIPAIGVTVTILMAAVTVRLGWRGIRSRRKDSADTVEGATDMAADVG